MARVHGRRGRIEIGSGSPLTVIGSLRAWSVSGARDKPEVTSFEDTNKNYLAGLPDVSGSFEGFFDTVYIGALEEAAASETGTNIKITPSLTYPDFYYEGPVWLDVSTGGEVNGAVTVSGTFVANGAFVRTVDGSPVGP